MLLLVVVAMVSIAQCFTLCGAAECEFVTTQGGGALEGGENYFKCIKSASLGKGRMKQTGTSKVCLGLLMEHSAKLTHWDPQLSGEQGSAGLSKAVVRMLCLMSGLGTGTVNPFTWVKSVRD